MSGCTVHLVDAGVDTGPIIAQAAVPVFETDDRESLAARILGREHALLVDVLRFAAQDRLRVVTGAPNSRRAVHVREEKKS